jgi:hypothetical protein
VGATTYIRLARGSARAALAAELVDQLKRLDRHAGVAIVNGDRRVRVTRLGDTFHARDAEGHALGAGDPAAIAQAVLGGLA